MGTTAKPASNNSPLRGHPGASSAHRLTSRLDGSEVVRNTEGTWHLVWEQPALAAIRAKGEGASTCLVALRWERPFQALITRAGSRIRRVRDLRDKRIGLSGASGSLHRATSLRGAIAALEAHGLHHRHVEWVSLSEAAVPHRHDAEDPHPQRPLGECEIELAALAAAKVDAVYVHGPLGQSAAASDAVRLLFDIGAHSDRWVRTNSAMLRTIVVELASLQEERAAVVQALATTLFAAGSPTKVYDRSAQHAGLLELTDDSREALEIYQQFLLRWGFLSNTVALATWIDAEPLAAARRQALVHQTASSDTRVA